MSRASQSQSLFESVECIKLLITDATHDANHLYCSSCSLFFMLNFLTIASQFSKNMICFLEQLGH